jgi:hypothetical protein
MVGTSGLSHLVEESPPLERVSEIHKPRIFRGSLRDLYDPWASPYVVLRAAKHL